MSNPQAALVEALPPLPTPYRVIKDADGCDVAVFRVFQMRDYARAALAQAEAAQPVAVYLVATGETHNGQETYTRHDSPPPLCEFERLYAAPQPAEAAPKQEAVADERAVWRAGQLAERERCAALCDGLAKVMTPDRRSTAEDLARAIREDRP